MRHEIVAFRERREVGIASAERAELRQGRYDRRIAMRNDGAAFRRRHELERGLKARVLVSPQARDRRRPSLMTLQRAQPREVPLNLAKETTHRPHAVERVATLRSGRDVNLRLRFARPYTGYAPTANKTEERDGVVTTNPKGIVKNLGRGRDRVVQVDIPALTEDALAPLVSACKRPVSVRGANHLVVLPPRPGGSGPLVGEHDCGTSVRILHSETV
jgi:hypothetical protein